MTILRTLSVAAVLLSMPLVGVGCGGSDSEDIGTTTSEDLSLKCGVKSNAAVQGVDVSHYQGAFDFHTAHKQFAYASVGDGSGYVDPEFDRDWKAMGDAGILRGAYQYFEPSQDPDAQADIVVKKVGKLGEKDMPAVIDVEKTGGESPGTIAARVKRWLDAVETGTGKKPIIYTGPYFWQDNVRDTTLGSYPLWIADYGVSCPQIPSGWSKWTMWQYSDGDNKLDHDVFNGTDDELKDLVAGGAKTADPKAPTTCGEFKSGEGLKRGESYDSCNKEFHVSMQTDGNFVLYTKAGKALWASHTYETNGEVVVMQEDGNLVVYGPTSNALFATHTDGHKGALFHIQDDGNLVIYNGERKAIWASHTN